jgi:hypothetical protein
MRALGGLNMGDSINNLETPSEINNFKNSLTNGILSLHNGFSQFIDQIIFVHDNFSWRKEIPSYKPYYVVDNRVMGYKEQRLEKKAQSSINYDNFYSLFNDFVDDLKTKMVVFDIKGLEGDDDMMLLSNRLSKLDTESYIFCTDGDLFQIVKDNVLLMRNIKSKDAPYGEFVINHKKYEKIFETSAKDKLLRMNTGNINYTGLFSLNLIKNGTSVKRTLHAGINIATPFKTALVKSICGDKKDNIFAILGWKASTCDREYRVTEKMLEKALALDKLFLTEQTCQNILMNPKMLENLMTRLKEITKQPDVEVSEMGKHLKHNLRINVLSEKNIPEQYLKAFEECYDALREQILTKKFDPTLFGSTNNTDNAVNIMSDSIPDFLKNL